MQLHRNMFFSIALTGADISVNCKSAKKNNIGAFIFVFYYRKLQKTTKINILRFKNDVRTFENLLYALFNLNYSFT